MDAINDDEFLVCGHLWLIAPKPRPEELTKLCKSILRAEIVRQDGTKGRHVPVFTDSDLAYRFIEGLEGKGAALKPFSSPTLEEFAVILLNLLELGDTHLGFDPEPTHVRAIPIPRVLEGMRNRRR